MSEERKVPDDGLETVTGGIGGWRQYAKGRYEAYDGYVVYHYAAGDVLSGVALRFGVSVSQILHWNNIRSPSLVSVGQTLTIYPTVIR